MFKFDDKIADDAGADMSGDFELTPLEPDSKGDDLMPIEPEDIGLVPIDAPSTAVAKPAEPEPPAEPLDFTF